MQEVIKSVGIDIGTSTTQLVFSELVVEDLSGGYTVPRVSIVDKKVVYRSGIYFTPLLSATEIDAEAVKEIVRKEYAAAGMTPADLKTGAVIITGETARKQNANEVLSALSDFAGDFVVATAGPDLESVLSARGAGTDRISEEQKAAVANVDVGGGTSNIALYEKGALKGVCCLDIGGRLVKVQDGRITYVYPKLRELAGSIGVHLTEGGRADAGELSRVCTLMADHVMQALYLVPEKPGHLRLYTNNGAPLPRVPEVRGVTFSGGVADSIYQTETEDCFRYGDIGVLLGRAIREHPALRKVMLYRAAETIRATVVGAGTHTMEVSGSTISYEKEELPVKNVPVLKIPEADEEDLETLESSLRRQMNLYRSERGLEQVAIALTGRGRRGFSEIQELAEAVLDGAKEAVESPHPLILVLEEDIAKALGNAVKVRLKSRKSLVCIDGIRTHSGDYIDIGEPLANGHVVPVVIKTLIFNS